MDETNEGIVRKQCCKCGKKYLATNVFFPKNMKTKDLLSPWCKACHNVASLQYKRRNSGSAETKDAQKEYRNITRSSLNSGIVFEVGINSSCKEIKEYCVVRAPQCNGCGFARRKETIGYRGSGGHVAGKLIPICPFGIPPYKWPEILFNRKNHKPLREPVLTRRKGEE